MISVYTKNIGTLWCGAASTEQRVFATSFAHSQHEALKSLLSSIPFNVPFQISADPSAFAENVLAAVKNVYDGNGFSQNFSLATEHLSTYTQRVLEATALIPLGYVTTYGAIAKAAGGSPRAVGRVMALNPFAPIVPCHRVVSSDFTLGGYGSGLSVKLEFLNREKRGFTSTQEILVEDRKLLVSPVESILKKIQADY